MPDSPSPLYTPVCTAPTPTWLYRYLYPSGEIVEWNMKHWGIACFIRAGVNHRPRPTSKDSEATPVPTFTASMTP